MEPATTVHSVADKVLNVNATNLDEAMVRIPRGPIRMVDYLRTCIFEPMTDTMDIQIAFGHGLTPNKPALKITTLFHGELILAHDKDAGIILASTERKELPSPFRLLP
jgi:hypothetical protein